MAATMAAFAITAAVLKVRETGVGERIDLGMADVLADWVETSPVMTDADAPVPEYGIYPTKDGRTITLGVVSERTLWAATCQGLRLEHHGMSRSCSGSSG